MNQLAKIAKALSILSLLIGVIGMSGWAFNQEILSSFHPSFIPMAPSTGVLFAAVGAAIWLIVARPTRGNIWLAQVVGVVAMLYAAWVLAGIFSGNEWNIDHLFVPQAEGFGAVKKGRMSPITATNFLLDGAALFLLGARHGRRERWPAISGSLALIALAITLTVLLGYLFGSPLLYGGTTVPMALSSALAFLCLDSAMIFAAGDTQFPLRHLAGKSTSARLLRWFLPLVVFGSIANELATARMDIRNDLNLALIAAVTVLITTLILIGVVMFASRRLGGAIDDAEAQRDLIQDRLLQQAKMAELGEMAGTIAHELNNPLTIVDGRTRQMLTQLGRGDVDHAAMVKYCDTMMEATHRSIKIIKALTAVARKADRDPPVTSSVKNIIDETLTLCASRSKQAGVSISVDCHDYLAADCRPGEIAQVLLNLLNNAFDAIDHAKAKWINVTATSLDGWLELGVTDSGAGVPHDLRDKVMQPFFTTKAYSKGTGLGLSISKSLIEGHGGRLILDEKSAHTRFIVRLPRSLAHSNHGGQPA